MKAQLTAALVVGNNPRRTVYIFVFQKSGVHPAVRIDQPVHAEVSVVRELAAVAAVGVDFPAVRRGSPVDGMVAPLPDKAAADAIVLLHELEIIFQIARAVAHGVTVFA